MNDMDSENGTTFRVRVRLELGHIASITLVQYIYNIIINNKHIL